jgi:hypothetical protein
MDGVFEVNLLQHALEKSSMSLNTTALPVSFRNGGRTFDAKPLKELGKFFAVHLCGGINCDF